MGFGGRNPYSGAVTPIFVVLTLVLVVVIGLVAVGRVTFGLAEQPPPSLFDLDEAVEFIAERLPYDVSAQLSYEDVRAIVGWHLDYLEDKGVAAETEEGLVEEQAAGSGPVVAAEDEAVAYVLGRATDVELEVDDVQIVLVLEAEMAYLEAIGAIGSQVRAPRDPDDGPTAEGAPVTTRGLATSEDAVADRSGSPGSNDAPPAP